MNGKAKILLALSALLIASQGLSQQPDSLPTTELRQPGLLENYVKKVLIEAKWGDGPGEFKLGVLEALEDGFHAFASSLTISEEGLIFIKNSDAVNVFNKNGVFIYSIKIATERFRNIGAMTVDSKKGFLYVKCYDTKNKRASILVMDIKKKEIVTSYTIPRGIGAIYFYNDMEGHIFVWSTPASGYYKSGTVEIFLPLELYAEDSKNGNDFLSKANADRKYKLFDQKLSTGENIKFKSEPHMISKSRNNLRAFLYGKNVSYIDVTGNARCVIEIENESWDKIDMARIDNIAFDKELNCYQVIGRAEGLKVIKYTPSEEIWK